MPEDKLLTPASEKRVRAIEEFSELGAGFKIAMRDLEIRGAGNILGREQSGHIHAVRYDMYCRLLKTSVKHLSAISNQLSKRKDLPKTKDWTQKTESDIIIDLNVRAFIPEDYISEMTLKLRMYRKIAGSSVGR